MAGSAARGASAYVSLEPCAHQGRTPPCARALTDAGVARVVTALQDPDPRTAGQGHAHLTSAGISVTTDILSDVAADVHRGFLMRVTEGRPWLTLKLATSFDGRIATATGDSQWITGPEARRAVHAERAMYDAVLVGGGTARADNPRLTVRGFGPIRQPVRIVASRHVNFPGEALAEGLPDAPLWICHGDRDGDLTETVRARWDRPGARLFPVQVGPGGQLDPAGLLAALGQAGLTRVFCEGGGALAASLLQAGLVDEIVGFTAGLVLGAEGRPAIGALGVDTLSEAPRFRLRDVTRYGPDVCHRWRRS